MWSDFCAWENLTSSHAQNFSCSLKLLCVTFWFQFRMQSFCVFTLAFTYRKSEIKLLPSMRPLEIFLCAFKSISQDQSQGTSYLYFHWPLNRITWHRPDETKQKFRDKIPEGRFVKVAISYKVVIFLLMTFWTFVNIKCLLESWMWRWILYPIVLVRPSKHTKCKCLPFW